MRIVIHLLIFLFIGCQGDNMINPIKNSKTALSVIN